MLNKYYLCILFVLHFLFISLYSDFEIIDEDSIIDTDEHLFLMLDTTPEKEFGSSKKLEYDLLHYLRYQDTTENFRNINRVIVKTNVFDLKLYQEYNTNITNTPIPFGGSLSISRKPSEKFILGQYQISHAYGLSVARGSFISQKPGFSTDFRQNRVTVSSNSRPYFSRSFLGVSYEKNVFDNFTTVIYSSLKETAARLTAEGKIDRLYIEEKYPQEKVWLNTNGGILHYRNGNLNASTAINYTIAEYAFQDNNVTPVTGSIAASYNYNQYLFFTETAYANSALANISGIRFNNQRFTQILSYRHFENGYNAIFADYISNSSNGTNEQGLFYKIEYRSRQYTIQSYADLFNNIDNDLRYMDRNQGVAYGVNFEKYGLYKYNDMGLGISYRQKTDKEWRNLSGISRYEDRIRDYLKITWTQTDTRTLRTRLILNYQSREYPDYDIKNKGYALTQNINIIFPNYRLSFTGGFFDTEIPIYLYLYAGRLNNSMYVLNGEGQFAMLHFRINKWKSLSVELMNSVLRKDNLEYLSSLVVGYAF